MNENTVAGLFNRAILDMLAGFLELVVLAFVCFLVLDINLATWLAQSMPFGYGIVLLLVASFLMGHLVDKVAFLSLDHTIFAGYFQTRSATFDVPQWCQKIVEDSVRNKLTVAPTRSRDLIDDSTADWITAYFLTKSRPEMYHRRADLVANYQFASNLLLVLIQSLVVIPLFLFVDFPSPSYWIGSFVILAVLVVFHWRFSVALIKRINTFENLAVFGLIVDGVSEGSIKEYREPHPSSSSEGLAAKPTVEGDNGIPTLQSLSSANSVDNP